MPVIKDKTETENLYSFDIFDTLITRKTATPTGIFYLMQEILKNNKNYSQYLRENFKTIRCEAEAFVRENFLKTKKWQDITFNDIYNRIQINHSLTDEETTFLKELEINCEIENLIPIEENINKLKKLISSGNEVILISDMYHNEVTLRNILTNIDSALGHLKIYVSSEYRKTKAKGDLYKYIKSEYQPTRWEHFGDNVCADFNSAKQNKIFPSLYNYVKFKEYEKYALKENNLTTEYIIGTAKNLRINSNNEKYNFGASFAGPILYLYVKWILDSSLKSKIEHLYFIARDGYIPKLIADIIIKEKNLPIKTHYIYGSRKAWRVPNRQNIDKFINSIFNEYLFKFSGKFLKERFDITSQELKKYTNLSDDNRVLRSRERKDLFNKLIKNQDFKDLIIDKNKTKIDLIIKYLEQEIDFSKQNFALVDINGTGSTQDLLKSTISLFNPNPIQTFYFCMDTKLSEYPDSLKKIYMCTNKYKHFWIELLCRNTDGQTLGYCEKNGYIEPITETINSQKLINWGYNDYIKGIIDFTRQIIAIETQGQLPLQNITFYYRYYNYIMNSIDKETADILGSIPYLDVGSEKLAKECAPAYNTLQLLVSDFLKNKDNALYFISKERSTKLAKELIKLKLKYKSPRKFLLDIHIHKKRGEAYICILGIIIDLHKFGYKE